MDMCNLRQIPSEAKIRTYLRHAIFGSTHVFYQQYDNTNPPRYENRFRCVRYQCKFSLLSHT